MDKTALYITFDGLSDPLGQSQILPYLRGLAAKGFTISILSCEKPERLEKEKQNILNSISGLPISWNYLHYNEKGGSFSRWQYVRQLMALAETERNKRSISLVHCRSYLPSLVGLRFKQKYNIPFVFDMRGFWADERIDGGVWHITNLFHRLLFRYFKRKEKQFLGAADAIISLTMAGSKELSRTYHGLTIEKKTTVIPCCTDTSLFSPSRVTAIEQNPGDHLLVYSGSIGTWYYTRQMIDCVITWKKFIPNIKLLILTRDQKELEELLKDYSNEVREIVICRTASYTEVPSYLKAAKACIFFIKPAYSKIASSPTKMAECWAMDLPIITNSGIGDNDFYFKKYNGGVLLPTFDKEAYERACQQYLELSNPAGHYRNIAAGNFDTTQAILTYEQVYRKLLK